MTTVEHGPAVVTVVGSPGCHLCDDAERALRALSNDVPLVVDLIDAGDPRGADLLRRHRAGMLPLVLVDGTFLSAGRLPRGKLRALLGRREAVA